MILHKWGVVDYEVAYEKMRDVHNEASKDKDNHLILCSHPSIFTVGTDDCGKWSVKTVKSDRGGSITCHSEGQAIAYFCFQVTEPLLFYRSVKRVYEDLFSSILPDVSYDKGNPGYYIENRKIASLGFRYRFGVSLHGVALNVDVDLSFHNQVSPCNIKGIVPTSLANEGIQLSLDEVNDSIVRSVCKAFDETI
ncbi:lipoyl protein ligase domain-containing protein [Hydrogenimonas thermophila]|uniref:Octanoyltransferase n=1 Tax=Hydrogenimonas thermophila TaxID=223786 RepID=A0A1I5QHR5_9BACT|nr:hypothetical protein [Hydrogenimonas thermophila]SFP45809.1 lipoyl(octanoyl) transferase [Hydrogenimonas thermophila]